MKNVGVGVGVGIANLQLASEQPIDGVISGGAAETSHSTGSTIIAASALSTAIKLVPTMDIGLLSGSRN